MLGLNMLDVLIGLVFLYFIMSVTCSAIMEGVSALLRWRPQHLSRTIRSLLVDGKKDTAADREQADATVSGFRDHPLVTSSVKTPGEWPSYLTARSFATTLLDLIAPQNLASGSRRTFWALRETISAKDSALVPPAGQADAGAGPLPAFLPSRRGDGGDPVRQLNLLAPQHSHLQAVLQAFVETATAHITDDAPNADAARLDALRAQIETWYDDSMDRASGWYKRRLQLFIFGFALLLTGLLNLDSISIAQRLVSDPTTRAQIVTMAATQVNAEQTKKGSGGGGDPSTNPGLLKESPKGKAAVPGAPPANTSGTDQAPAPPQPLDHMDSKPGEKQDEPTANKSSEPGAAPAAPHWNNEGLKQVWHDVGAAGLPIGWNAEVYPLKSSNCFGFWASKVCGLLITVFAVSLGAPFWFDVLGKLVSLRSAGAKPEKSDGLPIIAPSGPSDGTTALAALGSPSPGGGPVAPIGPQPGVPEDYWSQPARAHDVERFRATLPDPAVQPPQPTDPRAVMLTRAALLARASMLAYKPEGTIREVLKSAWGAADGDIGVFGAKDQQAFAVAFDKFVVLSFRGTVPAILQTIIADARICMVPFTGPPAPAGPTLRLHCGFRDASDALGPAIRAFLGMHAGKPLFLTGHSLGAAMATVFAAETIAAGNTPPIAGLFTFGSPRVGDNALTKWIDGALPDRSFRFVNDQDIVTRVAPRELGYEHISRIMYLNTNGTLDEKSEGWVRFLNTVIDAASDFKSAAQSQVKDHGIDLYVRKLDNLSNA